MTITVKITCDECGATRAADGGALLAGRVTSTGWYGWYGSARHARQYCPACNREAVARGMETEAARAAGGEHG